MSSSKLIEALENRLLKHQSKRKQLELLIDKNAATPSQKQRYVEIKAKEDELENIIDIIKVNP